MSRVWYMDERFVRNITNYHHNDVIRVGNIAGLWRYMVSYFGIADGYQSRFVDVVAAGKATDVYEFLKKAVLDKYVDGSVTNRAYDNKLNGLKKVVDKLRVAPKILLDIGSESTQYLDDAAALFGDARGLNIEVGFTHYNDEWKNKRITLYDGVNIPDLDKFGVKDKFDIVTMYSVMHHIPPGNIVTILRGLRKICKPGAILFIKENDLVDESSQHAFIFQHLVWWLGCSCKDGKDASYMNQYITRDGIIEDCAAAGWSLVYEYEIGTVFRVIYMAFRLR